MQFLSRRDLETVRTADGVGMLAFWLFVGLPIGYGVSGNNPVLTPLIACLVLMAMEALQWGAKRLFRALRPLRRRP